MKEHLDVATNSEGQNNEDRTLAKYEELASYEEAIKLRPDYVEAWYGRGVTLLDLKRPEEALLSFEEATRLRPDYAEAWLGKAIALRKIQELKSQLGKQGVLGSGSLLPSTTAGPSGSTEPRTATLPNLDTYSVSQVHRQATHERHPENHRQFPTKEMLDQNPFNLLGQGESLAVDGSNLIRLKCEPHNGKRCNNPGHIWILLDFLRKKEAWERDMSMGGQCFIVIDASLRHHVDDQAGLEDLIAKQAVIQMPPGHPSDTLILKLADELQAVVLTNDVKMQAEYAGQYPWLRREERFMRYVIVSDSSKKIEYVRRAATLPKRLDNHTLQARNIPASNTVLNRHGQPQESKHEHRHQPEQATPESQPPRRLGWLSRIRGSKDKQGSPAPEHLIPCPNCGAPIDVSNPRVRFCFRCRTQLRPK